MAHSNRLNPQGLTLSPAVAWLRRLGMPLARIRVMITLPPTAAAAALAEYWRQADAGTAAKRELATFLIGYLSGRTSSCPML